MLKMNIPLLFKMFFLTPNKGAGRKTQDNLHKCKKKQHVWKKLHTPISIFR